MFMPWNAAGGTKETFVVTVGGTVAAGDSWEFDGVTVVSDDAVLANFASKIHAASFPNWSTTVSSAAVTFTARTSMADGVITGDTAITGDTITDLGGSDLTMDISGGTAGAGATSVSDIIIIPSVHTGILVEHMLMHE